MSSPLGGNVWRLTVLQTLYGVSVNNVFFYNQPAGGGSANDLSDAFVQDVLTPMQNVQSEDLSWIGIEVTGVQGATDFDSLVLTSNGNVVDSAEPQFVAWSYRLNRLDNTDRNGYKRVAGVPDEWWALGVIDPANIATLNACADAFTSGISTGGIGYNPCIQRRQQGGVAVVPPQYYSHAGFTFAGITTQNTRKT